MYLAPIVNTFGDEVVTMLNATNIQAWGLYDVLYLKAKGQRELSHHLFVLQDPNGIYNAEIDSHVNAGLSRRLYQAYLKIVRKSIHYVDDYPFDMQRKQHVTVFRVPPSYTDTYDHFISGEFSRMYNEFTLERIGIKQVLRSGKPNLVYQILTRKAEYRQVFQDKINRMFNTTVVLEDSAELDSFAINPTYEVLNADFTGPYSPS